MQLELLEARSAEDLMWKNISIWLAGVVMAGFTSQVVHTQTEVTRSEVTGMIIEHDDAANAQLRASIREDVRYIIRSAIDSTLEETMDSAVNRLHKMRHAKHTAQNAR